VRSTFYCLSCKTGYENFHDLVVKTLHGIRHNYEHCAEKGYWAVAMYCKGCDMPVFTKLKHLVPEQQAAFRRHNKKERKDGKAKKNNAKASL